MPISIVAYNQQHIQSVAEFNARLRSWNANPEFELPECPTANWLPEVAGAKTYNRIYLAIEKGVVRGAYVLKQEQLLVNGGLHWAGSFHHAYSEGNVNHEYAMVGPQMVLHALRTQPLLYGLGLNGYDQPLTQMLIRMGWKHCKMPFQFRVLNAKRFFDELPALRSSRTRQIATKLLSSSGGARLVMATLQGLQVFARRGSGTDFEFVEEFSEWADEVWDAATPHYPLLFRRDVEVLRTLYPRSPCFHRLRVKRGSTTVGWAVIGDIQNRNNTHYGNLRVGAILDTLSNPEDARLVVNAATQALKKCGVDLIVTNQSHYAWIAALRMAGFLSGPSNFIFAASKKLSALLEPFVETVSSAHLNRSGSDGLHIYEYANSVLRQRETVTQARVS